MNRLVYRRPFGKTFTYRYQNGKTVKNENLKTWIASLAIPPAWTEVEIDLDRSAKIHAWGRDKKGRKQYIYNPQCASAASEAKFQRILRFAERLKTMRRVTGQHIKRRPIDEMAVLACMTRMMDEAFFRPGSEAYSRTNQTFGLTTLRSRHAHFEDEKVTFNYVGKSHQQQQRQVSDEQVKAVLQELDQMVGHDLFDVTLADGQRKKLTSHDLNHYIAEVMGEDFSAKDFRTWAGTMLVAVALDELGPAQDTRSGEKNILKAVKGVAKDLGNTPAVCRNNYIHPHVITQYQSGRTLKCFRNQLTKRSGKLMTRDEKATLQLLKHVVDEARPGR